MIHRLPTCSSGAFCAIAITLLGCKPVSYYGYSLINDSDQQLTNVRVLDPNFPSPIEELAPYWGGTSFTAEGAIPSFVEVRWQRHGHGSGRSVQVKTGLDCPGRPPGEVKEIGYWIRADDSVRTRLEVRPPVGRSVTFVPCETPAERSRRLANEGLESAALSGEVARIEAALKGGASINPRGYFDPTPLRLAAGEGHMAAVRYLVANGAHIEVPQRVGSGSALMVAIEQSQFEVAAFLIDSGADLNNAGSGYSPLLLASERGHMDLVKLLLDRGADINLQVAGQSALVDAARAGQLAIVRVLLDRGADPNTTIGGDSTTALDIAEEFQRQEVAELLRERGGRRGPPH